MIKVVKIKKHADIKNKAVRFISACGWCEAGYSYKLFTSVTNCCSESLAFPKSMRVLSS